MQTSNQMGAPNRRDLRKELVADLEQIEDNIALYKAGRDSAYKTVALQLRTILLGERRGLLVRVCPKATLQPVADSESSNEPEPASDQEPASGRKKGLNDLTLFGHAQLRLPWRGERGSITLPIDERAAPLSVGEWLDQWIVRPDVKIRALIRSAADEEVAHTQDERGKLLAMLAGTGVMRITKEDFEAGRIDGARVAQEMYQMAIIGIGEYVAHRTRELLAEDTP